MSSGSPSPAADGQHKVLVQQLRRKVLLLEQQQADLIHTHNEECVELQTHVIDLRAALEKNEAQRQHLGYEFDRQAVASREQIYSAADKEASLSQVNIALQGQVAELTHKIEEREEVMQHALKECIAQQEKLLSEVQTKESLLEACEAEKKALEQELELMDVQCKYQAVEVTQLKKNIETLQGKLESQSETVKRQAQNLETRVSQEEKLKKVVERTYKDLQNMEETLESERAAHLESKFNSEIVQLRVRDLEAALETEKVASGEANMSIDMLKQQLRDLKHSLETEQQTRLSLGEKIEEQQREWVGKELALTAEIEEKQSVVSSLSEQLDQHEKNFEVLKTELLQARHKQRELEETYVSCMSELEVLVRSMQSALGSPDSLGSSKLPPSAVLSSLKQLLTNYQSNFTHTSSELSAVKLNVNRLMSECEHYKDVAQSRDSAVKSVQKSLSDAQEELMRIKSQASDRDTTVIQLTDQLARRSQRLEREREKRHLVKEELKRIRQGLQEDSEIKCQFLQSLYERLLAGRVVLDSEQSHMQFTWPELTTMVAEQISSLLLELERLQNKVKQTDSMVKRKEQALSEATVFHQQGLNKLSQAVKHREKAWQQQRRELESHYSEMLQELQSKAEKTQAMADEAWERLRDSDKKQEELEAECEQLRSKTDGCDTEMSSLQAGCGLLSGALLAQFNRMDMLVTHKMILSERCHHLDELQQRIYLLLDDLTISNGTESQVPGLSQEDAMRFCQTGLKKQQHRAARYEKTRPVMRFRVAVVAVLAVNRLVRLGQLSSLLFTDARGVSVIGANYAGSVSEGGNMRHPVGHQTVSERLLLSLSWLCSSQCRRVFTDCLSAVPAALSVLPVDDGDMNDSASNPDTVSLSSRRLAVSNFPDDQPAVQHVVSSLRSAFSRTVSALLAEFSSVDMRGLSNGYLTMGRRGSTAWSLIELLRSGLDSLIHKRSPPRKAQSQQCMDMMEQHVTELLSRLRDCEVERCELQSRLSVSEEEVRRLSEACQQINILQTTMKRLEKDSEGVVPRDVYDRLLVESRTSKHCAREQEMKARELARKIEHKQQDLLEKEATLAQAVKDLADLKMEVQRRGESVQQLNRRMSVLEEDKRSLRNELQHCQLSLQVAAREEDLILEYLLSVDEALQTTVGQVSARQLVSEHSVSLLKLPKLESSDRAGLQIPSHIAACQAIVRHVTDFHHQATTAVASLRAEIESHRAHAAALHAELTTACRRQKEDGQ